MSDFQHLSDVGKHHHSNMIEELEAIDPGLAYMLVPGSQLQQAVGNPGGDFSNAKVIFPQGKSGRE